MRNVRPPSNTSEYAKAHDFPPLSTPKRERSLAQTRILPYLRNLPYLSRRRVFGLPLFPGNSPENRLLTSSRRRDKGTLHCPNGAAFSTDMSGSVRVENGKGVKGLGGEGSRKAAKTSQGNFILGLSVTAGYAGSRKPPGCGWRMQLSPGVEKLLHQYGAYQRTSGIFTKNTHTRSIPKGFCVLLPGGGGSLGGD